MGKASVGKIAVFHTYKEPEGLALFCPQCAEVWFHSPVDSFPSYPYIGLCDRHDSPRYAELIRPAGSVWLEWDKAFNASLPVSLLIREFLLLMKEMDKVC